VKYVTNVCLFKATGECGSGRFSGILGIFLTPPQPPQPSSETSENSPYESHEQMEDVRGVSHKVFEGIEKHMMGLSFADTASNLESTLSLVTYIGTCCKGIIGGLKTFSVDVPGVYVDSSLISAGAVSAVNSTLGSVENRTTPVVNVITVKRKSTTTSGGQVNNLQELIKRKKQT
jgi:hypothetical protein